MAAPVTLLLRRRAEQDPQPWQSADLLDLSHRGAAVLTRASQSFEIGAELSLDCSGVPGLGPSLLEAVVHWSQDDVDLAFGSGVHPALGVLARSSDDPRLADRHLGLARGLG